MDIQRISAESLIFNKGKMSAAVFYLKVQRVEQFCLFELSWGKGQQLGVTIPYPETLTTLYQNWQQVYLSFYKKSLRGRVEATGSLGASPVDWHAKLVQAEAKLLYEFHHWLRSAQLYEIRAVIAQTTRGTEDRRGKVSLPKTPSKPPPKTTGKKIYDSSLANVEVFLTCNPLDLARLPWEAWEIGTEFASAERIRIVRTPLNIRAQTLTNQRRCRGKARILAILGDDTGLNFQADQEAVQSLSKVAEIEFVGWQPGQSIPQLKEQIVQAITDERGWDILFFAGHSNETVLTGGELAIAPGVALFLSEIAPQLTIAKERGLQFALFNSCNGLSLANALIDLGLSQVAVMREPVHNRVAQEFLVRFLQRLAEYQDVHSSLLAACQYLKLEKQLTYPSSYLIPSLFRHPDAQLFRLEPFGVKQQLRRWLPTRQEAVALGIFVILSCLPAVQDFFMERRVWMQAVYRHTTNQVPSAVTPAVLLVEIDQESLRKANIDARKINPIDRTYIASLVDKLVNLDAKIIGLDYLLDSPTDEDPTLEKSVQSAIEQKGTWFVFAALKKGNEELGLSDSIAPLDRVLQAYINAPLWYIPLLPAGTDCTNFCPLAYQLSLIYALNQKPLPPDLPQPHNFSSQTNLRTQLIDYLNQRKMSDQLTAFLYNLRLSPITSFSRQFDQLWLYPIIDFSIPPHQAFQRINAWELLENANSQLTAEGLKQRVVLIAAGGYDQAGTTLGGDNFSIPKAIAYWRSQDRSTPYPPIFAGAEAHSYMLHQLLTQRLVVPIPDLWMLGIAVILGKGTQLMLLERKWTKRQQLMMLTGGTIGYGLVGLQLYISAGILMPWLLPSAVFWMYILLIEG